MKKWIVGILLVAGLSALAGSVGLPSERVALPLVEGDYLVCVWDDTAQAWGQPHEAYSNSGAYDLTDIAWEKWYWIGLWDSAKGEYVFGKWVGHFKTDEG